MCLIAGTSPALVTGLLSFWDVSYIRQTIEHRATSQAMLLRIPRSERGLNLIREGRSPESSLTESAGSCQVQR
jgi:hypothetical protein